MPFSSKDVNHMANLDQRGHSCVGCAAVCLTVMPLFSDITDVSTIGQNSKSDDCRICFYFTSRRTETALGLYAKNYISIKHVKYIDITGLD